MSTCKRMLLLREFDGMQEKTPLWLALTRAMSSELTVVSAAAGGGRLSENTMRTLEDGGRVSPDAADGLAEDDGATSTSCNYRRRRALFTNLTGGKRYGQTDTAEAGCLTSLRNRYMHHTNVPSPAQSSPYNLKGYMMHFKGGLGCAARVRN